MSWLRCKVKDWLREEVFKEELEKNRLRFAIPLTLADG